VGYFFTGFVDDVGVWSRALLPEEIQELVEGCESIPTFGISGNQTPSNYTATSYSYPATEGSSYEWEVTNGIIQSGQGTSTIDVVWAGEGLGSLMVVETSVNGCVGDPVVLDVVIIPTSVEESSAQPFRVYPNPAAGTLFIECGASTERGQGFDLLDPSGRLVLSGMVQGLRTMLDIQGLPSGVYHLELAGAVRRVIIQ
jgi:hypothetical protein